MLVRKEIELSRRAMVRALCSPAWGRRATVLARIAGAWSTATEPVVTLSVRSAFDVFLSERAYPEGSEIVMTGANVPDMARIAEHHGLRICAVDFELRELLPSVDAVEGALTERARAIVITQLFGARVDLSPYADVARRHGLDLIEDAAQAFDADYRGHPDATISMFSFGPIKRVTALGGAVSTVGDEVLAARMRRRLDRQPVSSGLAFRRRLLKYLALTTMGRPRMLGVIDRHLGRRGRSLDSVLARSTRSFAGVDLIPALRARPSRPLLSLVARRLSRVPHGELQAQAGISAELSLALRDRVEIPGESVHGRWVFPVLCDDPDALVRDLRTYGFDATRVASLGPIGPYLPRLTADFRRLVYLPFSVRHTAADRSRLVRAVREVARSEGLPPLAALYGKSEQA